MVSDFDKNINISYVEDDLPKPDNNLVIKHCICSDLIYLFVYFLLLNNPFFHGYFKEEMQHAYINCFWIYVVISPVIYFIFRPRSLHSSHNIEICNYCLRIFKQLFCKDTVLKKDYLTILQSFVPKHREKHSLILMFIKVFFGVIMVNSLLNNCTNFGLYIERIKQIIEGFSSFTELFDTIISDGRYFFDFTLLIIYIVDLIPFVIGYLTECSFLKNKVKTVETSFCGLFFCLICYPPFNNAFGSIVGWNQKDHAIIYGEDSVIGWIIRFLALFFIALYAYSSVALGTKASNLTNRGIVSKFPYNIVRHPAYFCKNTFWFLTTIPVFFVEFSDYDFILGNYILKVILVMSSFLFWAWVYYMRAITEERHLMQDPDYQEYCKKVKWRFIPFII